MAFDISCFGTLAPSRYITFTIPYSYGDSSNPRPLRVAVLDSPAHHGGRPRVAAILVPENREGDWIFCTETGHLQLLSDTPDVSRLILAGREPSGGGDGPSALRFRGPPGPQDPLEGTVGPLLSALSPKVCFHSGVPEVPIFRYEDDLISSVTIKKCTGDSVGEMLVEDVELECGGQESVVEREFRRRLRFRRMPNLVQSQVRIVSESDVGTDIGKARFRIDSRALVHPYLAPMVASLSLASPHIEDRCRLGSRPKALCLGVGGGALVSFLKDQLGFEVLGLEIDATVIRVARKYFGLEDDSEMVRIIHGDAIEFVKKVSGQMVKGNSVSSDCVDSTGAYGVGTLFDAIMVDLDSGDVRNGLNAPPLEFLEESVLVALKSILCESGILAVNVIPSNRRFYEMLLSRFREVFCELYEIDVGNIVIIATVASIAKGSAIQGSSFTAKLKTVISGAYIESIKKI